MTARDQVGLVYNSQLPEAAELVGVLAESPGLKGRCWTSPATDVSDVAGRLERTSLVVTVGGDGTILRTVRMAAPFAVPIVGINMGRVGFMTELSVEDALTKLPAYLEGDLRIEERMMLQASVTSDSEDSSRVTAHALNDVVVGRGGVARLIDIETAVDGVALTSYRADGVIVSTPTGSTGYALSAGGPILYPEARLMLLQPVAAHIGLRDALVLPEDSVVELRASDAHHIVLSVDGFMDTDLDARDTVTVKRSPHVARFLRGQPPGAFYGSLTRRLGVMYRGRSTDSGGDSQGRPLRS